jgi:hypothetical protein
VRNRRLRQNQISARLARVEPDDRTILCGECETFRLAIQIAEPTCVNKCSRTAAGLKMSDGRNRGASILDCSGKAVRFHW